MFQRNKEIVAFYNSNMWIATRKHYMISQRYLCERCYKENKIQPAKVVHHKEYINENNVNDYSVTLDWNNLEALCQDCHNKEHFKEDHRVVFDSTGHPIGIKNEKENIFKNF